MANDSPTLGNCRKCQKIIARGILAHLGGQCSECYAAYLAAPLPEVKPQKWKQHGGRKSFLDRSPGPLFDNLPPAIPLPNQNLPPEDLPPVDAYEE